VVWREERRSPKPNVGRLRKRRHGHGGDSGETTKNAGCCATRTGVFICGAVTWREKGRKSAGGCDDGGTTVGIREKGGNGTMDKIKIGDNRTWQQAEDVADRMMEQAESSSHNVFHAQELRDQAIFNMLRAILLKLPAQGTRL
jgi:hypothetical protein